MACPSNEQLISFVYRELSPGAQADVEKHLGGCADCRQEVAELNLLEESLPAVVQDTWDNDDVIGDCPDNMMLARYSAGSLTQQERASMEVHLASCDGCISELVAVHETLEEVKTNTAVTPAHLLAQARKLGASTPQPEATPGVFEQIKDWWRSLTAVPQWALAGAGSLAVLLLAINLIQRPPIEGPGTIPINQPNVPHSPKDLVRDFTIELTPELKQALLNYNPKSGPSSNDQVLSVIRTQGAIPETIKEIEIHENLLIAIAKINDLAGQAKIRLYKDGTMVISGNGP